MTRPGYLGNVVRELPIYNIDEIYRTHYQPLPDKKVIAYLKTLSGLDSKNLSSLVVVLLIIYSLTKKK